MNTKACDECGADGERLQCICAELAPTAKPKKVVREPAPQPSQLPKSGTNVPKTGMGEAAKVMCCRCRDVHFDVDRINEWGVKANKVMSGRMTWCPKGCGYHVTIPAD